MDPALDLLAGISTDRTDPGGGLVLLLADFLGCVQIASSVVPVAPFVPDGVGGEVAALALRASCADRDDVDWRSLHHPGSIVWPVALAVAAEVGASGDRLTAAARHGYAVAATMADILGSAHRRTWHVTATAGAIAAAATASVLLGSDVRTRRTALALAAANCGGLAQAALERSGAAAFNRSAAATLGLASARAAVAGAVGPRAPITGPGGLQDAMAADATTASVRDGLADAAPRFLPVCGFLQSAVAGTATARATLPGRLVSIQVGLAPAALGLVDGAVHGLWWDATASVLQAWFGSDGSCPAGSENLVSVVPEALGIGHARIRAVTDTGSVDLTVAPPTLQAVDATERLLGKWTDLLGPPGAVLVDLAERLLVGPGPVDDVVTGLLR